MFLEFFMKKIATSNNIGRNENRNTNSTTRQNKYDFSGPPLLIDNDK